jgi:hypothetical protein
LQAFLVLLVTCVTTTPLLPMERKNGSVGGACGLMGAIRRFSRRPLCTSSYSPCV